MAASYTNFCCRSGGSNLNAGTRLGDTTVPGTSANLTYASGTWVSATGVFTLASGDAVADGVAVGDWASVYANGATVTTLVGRVTARTTSTITVSLTAKGGATTDGTSNRTLKIGGAWLGPNGATPWLDTFPQAAMVNAAGDPVRVNLCNDQTYSVTANIPVSTGDVANIEGFATAYGDGGRAVIDGGVSVAGYILMTLNGATTRIANVELMRNGNSASNPGISHTASSLELYRCVLRDMRGNGISVGAQAIMIECEVYNCNTANGANLAGVNASFPFHAHRCIFHSNLGTNTAGIRHNTATAMILDGCVFDNNGTLGGVNLVSAGGASVITNCDFHANIGPGVNASVARCRIENSNFLDNGTYGVIGGSPGSIVQPVLVNCGFGTGTMANASGDISGNAEEVGSFNYGSSLDPWNDRAGHDWSIIDPLAEGTGRGAFLQTYSGYTVPTISYPDVGAGQHEDTGGGGGGPIGGGNLSGGLQ